jgi:hypothetical protein
MCGLANLPSFLNLAKKPIVAMASSESARRILGGIGLFLAFFLRL